MNTNKKTSNHSSSLPLLFLLAIFAALSFVSCKPNAAESKPANVDYYTCTMHPSVKSQDPHAKCPICGMDLVPVQKKTQTTNQTAGTMDNMPGMSGMGMNSNREEEPTDFTVPVKRQQQIGVTFGIVEKHHFQRTVRAVGIVAAGKQLQWDYVSRVDGYVQKLDVFSPGEAVEKNAPLLTIYSPELFTAQKEFVDALRMRDNAQTKGDADVLRSAEQLVESGKERLRLWNIGTDQIAELEKSRKPRETLALFSPFKGVVQEMGVEQGRHIAAGDRLVDVADLSVVWVWAQFYQDDLPILKKGLSVAISASSYPGETLNGKIGVVDPFVNEALRTGRVRIDVDNPDLKLRPGMYVDVRLSVDMGGGLAVPAGAILPTGLHNIAFVDKGEGRLEPRFVELGGEYGDSYEVKSGLDEGERVVTGANFLIDAEAKVQAALKTW